MTRALIGFSGFVGSTLLRQTSFDELYRSSNIHEITSRPSVFDTVVCAAAPGKKWHANLNAEADRARIANLIQHLKDITCQKFILISTADVFEHPIGVDEHSVVDPTHLAAYGRHRYDLELFVRRHFSNHLIVRLPGLVGPGLRKNIVFDLLNGHQIDNIDSRDIFQFYPIVNLWYDIQTALKNRLKLIHLTAEPLSVRHVAQDGFGRDFQQMNLKPLAKYDIRSLYTDIFGAQGHYHYAQRDSIQAIRTYAQSELPTPEKTLDS